MDCKRHYKLFFLRMTRLAAAFFALAFAVCALPAFSLADGESDDDLLKTPSAANAAKLLRAGEDSAALSYWDTAQSDASSLYRMRKGVRAMLACATGGGTLPAGRAGIQFQPDPEMPLIQEDDELQYKDGYNIRGSVYTDSPLLSVTADVESLEGEKGVTASVTFDSSAGIYGYSLDRKTDHSKRSGLDTLFDVSRLRPGKYRFSITAASQDLPDGTILYTADFTIVDNKKFMLTQNKFDDNYDEVSAFFGGDTDKFLFRYWLRESRSISTDPDWREAYLVESSLGRVHADALPYFELANYYLDNTYISVTIVNPKNGNQTTGRVTLLKKLISKKTTYVPRFQSNLQYLSHHTLGTAIDVNDDLYPNKNAEKNHAVIGDDVRGHLVYNGIKTTEAGLEYYDFTYDGDYSARFARVPKSIVNYLLYELAFFRAGFQWGYYYESTCDAMHFTLAEFDVNRHMYSDIGLRKIYDYIEDPNEPALASFAAAAPAEETPPPEETPSAESTPASSPSPEG
jgi:hypothetical protein